MAASAESSRGRWRKPQAACPAIRCKDELPMHKKNNAVRVVASLALLTGSVAFAAPQVDIPQFNDFWTPDKPKPSLCGSPLTVCTQAGLRLNAGGPSVRERGLE